MATPYKTNSGRIIMRASNGKFRKARLSDLGLTENDKGYYVCNDCGEGKYLNNTWHPILKPEHCPKCKSENIEPLKIKLSEKAIKLKTEIDKHTKGTIDPNWFRKHYNELKREYDKEADKCLWNTLRKC